MMDEVWGGVLRHSREDEVAIRYDHCDTCTDVVDSEWMMSYTRLSGAAKCRRFKLSMNDRPTPRCVWGPSDRLTGPGPFFR